MNFLLVLIATAIAALILKPIIKKAPVAWYIGALALDALFFASMSLDVLGAARNALLLLVQKGTLALALFTIVMFIGAFSHESRLRRHLGPIRAELAIIACILVAGHMAFYLASYAERMLLSPEALATNVLLGLTLAIALLILVVVLGVTSFNFVKRRMSSQTWKRIQEFSYLFYGLVYAHLLLMLVPSVMAGSAANTASLIIYTIVFAAYALARYRRFKLDERD